MKVALIGASGRIGSRVLAELARRGHAVTAIARHPDKITPLAGVTPVAGNASDPAALAKILTGNDVVVSAVRFKDSDPNWFLAAVKAAGVPRYIAVGGAGSLEIAPGKKFLDDPSFPDTARPEATAGAAFHAVLKQERDLDWTFLSPPSLNFAAGARTGKYRTGGDTLLKDAAISYEDYAVALVDELEQPRHLRRRFTVSY